MAVYRRKNGAWCARLELPRGPGGERRYTSVGVYPTKKAAELALAMRRADVARDGDLIPAERLTVAHLIERYLEDRAAAVVPSTLQRYRELMAHVVPVIGSTLLSKLTPGDVARVYAVASASGLAPGTVRDTARVLGSIMQWAVDHELAARNPCRVSRSSLPKLHRKPARALTEDEANALLDAAGGTSWQAFIRISLCTGARRGEVAAMKWANVDLERARVTISESLTRRGIGSTKTGKTREVALNTLAVATLKTHRSTQAAELLATGAGKADLVFCDSNGHAWNPQSISHAFKVIAERAGISGVKLHTTRHTYITWRLRDGTPVHIVAQAVGHSSPTITLQMYAHVLPTDAERGIERISERLRK